MENQTVKRGRGRPKTLTDEQRRTNKTRCMLKKEWYCDICETGRNYTLAGKHCHLKTKKHTKNRERLNTCGIDDHEYIVTIHNGKVIVKKQKEITATIQNDSVIKHIKI